MHTCGGGGVPQPGPAGGGVPYWRVVPLLGGTPPRVLLSDLAWGQYPYQGVPHLRYPSHQTWLGVPLSGGTPPWVPPIRPGQGGGYPTSGNRWSTWYAVVGMPLAFTQEDFLVEYWIEAKDPFSRSVRNGDLLPLLLITAVFSYRPLTMISSRQRKFK